MNIQAVQKKVSIQYSKRAGNPRIEFWLQDDRDVIKTIRPQQWLALDLPDTTTDYAYTKAAQMLFSKLSFQDQIDLHRWFKDDSINIKEKFYTLIERN